MTNVLSQPLIEQAEISQEPLSAVVYDERSALQAFVDTALTEAMDRPRHLESVTQSLELEQPTLYKWQSKRGNLYYWPQGNAGARYLISQSMPEVYSLYLHISKTKHEALGELPSIADAIALVNSKEQI